jgi:hypothetical protein
MSFDYIRRYYGVPAKRGMRVAWSASGGTRLGTITKATHYVYVRFDGVKHSVPLHPKEDGLQYLDDAAGVPAAAAVMHTNSGKLCKFAERAYTVRRGRKSVGA